MRLVPQEMTSFPTSNSVRDFFDSTHKVFHQALKTSRITEGQWAVEGVSIWRTGGRCERIDAEELAVAGSYFARAEVDESGVGAGVLAVVAERGRRRAFAGVP